jgi:tetratricopeptide (TPR) repeat protein
VGDGAQTFEAESGQALFDFDTAEVAREVARIGGAPRRPAFEGDAAEWYERGCDLEAAAPSNARAAYARAIELEPGHADAHVNLGRLLHEDGDASGAAGHYRAAIEAQPEHSIAAFNLGAALEDLRLPDEAALAYRLALQADPACADAHYNLAILYERKGDAPLALRHLRTYRKLVQA